MRLCLETIIGTAAHVAHALRDDTPEVHTSTAPESGRSSGKSGRRQTLAQECSWADVARAINRRKYAGDVVPAVRVDQVVAALDASPHPRLRRMRADGYATLRQVALVLAWSADWQVQRERKGQMLVSVPQRVLAERCGRSERTIRRHLRVLEEVGLLATVREGTTDEFRPSVLEDEGNVVPVYLLLLPVSVLADVPGCERLAAELAGAQSAADELDEDPTPAPSPAPERTNGEPRRLSLVDIDVRPPFTPLGSERHPPHARETATQTEPLRGPEPHGGATRRGLRAADRHLEAVAGTATGSPEEPRSDFSQVNAPIERRWHAHETPQTKPERLAAADELRWRLPVLRRISAAHVRHVAREFFLAGWTVLDVHYAIDYRPDGTPVPHSGDLGVIRPADWLAHRLAAWRDETGTVTRSRSQRLALERAEQRARTRANQEAAAIEAARRAAVDESPAAAAAKRAIRETIAAVPPRRRDAGPPLDTRPPLLR